MQLAHQSRLMSHSGLVAFTLVAALLTITPGLDTALVLRTAIVNGPLAGMTSGVGIALGCLAWGLLAVFGLGALLAASDIAFVVVKWLGAMYLFYLGVKLIVVPRATFGATDAAAAEPCEPHKPRGHLARGLLTNLLNPKVGVFYISFLPQFVPPHGNVTAATLTMTAIHAVLGLTWFAVLCLATRPLNLFLQCPTVMRWLDRITGGVFITFGARLALERR